MLEEELREEEVVAEEPREEAAVAEAPKGGEDGDKYTLITFILSVVGFTVGWGWIVGGIAGIILCAIALKRGKAGIEPTKQPFITFKKVAKIVAIVGLIASIIMTVVYTILFIVEIAAAAVAAANA